MGDDEGSETIDKGWCKRGEGQSPDEATEESDGLVLVSVPTDGLVRPLGGSCATGEGGCPGKAKDPSSAHGEWSRQHLHTIQ